MLCCRPAEIPRTIDHPLRKAHAHQPRVEQREKVSASFDQIEIHGHEAHAARRVEVDDQTIAALLGAFHRAPPDSANYELMQRTDHNPLIVDDGHRLERSEYHAE